MAEIFQYVELPKILGVASSRGWTRRTEPPKIDDFTSHLELRILTYRDHDLPVATLAQYTIRDQVSRREKLDIVLAT